MSEYVRDITLRIVVDTNKRTFVLDRDADTLGDASEQVTTFLADVLEGCR